MYVERRFLKKIVLFYSFYVHTRFRSGQLKTARGPGGELHRGAALIAVRERPRVCRKRMLRTRRVSRVEGRRSGWRQLVVGPIVVPTNGTQKGALAMHLRHEASEKLREHLWPVQSPSLPPLSSPIFSLKRQQLASNNCELRSWGCIATHGHITSGSAGREGTGGLQSSSPLALRGS